MLLTKMKLVYLAYIATKTLLIVVFQYGFCLLFSPKFSRVVRLVRVALPVMTSCLHFKIDQLIVAKVVMPSFIYQFIFSTSFCNTWE